MAEKPTADLPEDDDYVSSEDGDFAPDNQASSESESEQEQPGKKTAGRTPKKSPRKPKAEEKIGRIDKDEVEGLMKDAGKKKRRRKDDDADDSGGEVGYVKTRSMRATQNEERKKALASADGATIDVDAIWQKMMAQSLEPSRPKTPPPPQAGASAPPSASKGGDADMITITQTYNFAGQTHTETVRVARTSEQAKAHLAEEARRKQAADDEARAHRKLHPDTGEPLLRPLRRVSAFEPNPAGAVRNLPGTGAAGAAGTTAAGAAGAKKKGFAGAQHKHGIPRVRTGLVGAPKLTVLDKTSIDWRKHVEATGDREELDAAQKAKGAYLDKQDFLDRVGGRQDEEYLKLKGK